ncbi:hypothetical protein [Tomitella fengzijianii]|uniref:Uncharacterized protein n=1 Tax=Tomitella fengzijianii TaxID=2597660 RepID=A0A516X4I8_9ACTN|nr:hypothetical protein [Tomitella fengzijianii]QDQ97995.1 hypothetical protein FO059_12545 [Tomitella fengzijianii]
MSTQAWPDTFTIKTRRDDGTAWADYNPTLEQGEPGFETDTGLFKIGDGIAQWTELPYTTTSFYSATEAARLELDARIPGARRHTMNANTTITITDPPSGYGGNITVALVQDTTGGRTVTWPDGIRWLSGSAPTVDADPGAMTIIQLQWFGEWTGRHLS